MTHWTKNAFFYHIYPLGACRAPKENNLSDQPVPRLRQIENWLDHIQGLGCNAIYLGPIFESGSHGYDTINYYEIDRRLGTREDMTALSAAIHGRGMRLVLDGVFNHVGRDFWAFRDLQANGQYSAYRDWFANLRFDGRSPYGDPFVYEAWNGHFSLVKLNLTHPAVREHLFGAIQMWVDFFQIDGIRLDAADVLDFDFLRELRSFCDAIDPNLWLMGEVIHGDYTRWANGHMLHSTTNYELFKSLYSAHNDRNYFELAYSLNREFGEGGIYRGLNLFNFVDNHDVTRIASQLKNLTDLFPLHVLLLTTPGVPSIYYGSEFGTNGVKSNDDWQLRPGFDLKNLQKIKNVSGLQEVISLLARIRNQSPALSMGGYEQLMVTSNQLVFARRYEGELVLVAVNNEANTSNLELPVENGAGSCFIDVLNNNENFTVDSSGKLEMSIFPKWGRILKRVS